MNKQRKSAKKIELLETIDRVMELRKKGFTYQAIAKELKIHPSRISKYLQAGFQMLQEKSKISTEEMMLMQNARLEDMYKGLSNRIDKGESRAIEVGIKVLERQSKLFGLDAPVKQENLVTYQHLTDAELLDEARKFQLDVHLHPPQNLLLPGESALPPLLEHEVIEVFTPSAEENHAGSGDENTVNPGSSEGERASETGISIEPTGIPPSHSD